MAQSATRRRRAFAVPAAAAAGGDLRRRAPDLRRRPAVAGRSGGGARAVRAPWPAAVPEWRRGPVRHSAGDAGPAAGLPDRLRLRGPERRRHACAPTRCSSWSAGGCRRRGPTWPASRPSRGWRTRCERPRCYRLAVALGDRLPARAGAGRGAHAAIAARPGRHGRPDPRRAGGDGLPRLLPPAHVPPPAGLRRRHRPAHHRRAAPGQRPRQPGARSPSSSAWCARCARAGRGWPIELRADSGFAVPALYAWCEAGGHRLHHRAGPQPPPGGPGRPAAGRGPGASRPRPGPKVRLAGETAYQAGSWPHPRRVVFKAEALAKGPNTRFVVTTRARPARWPSTTGTSTAGEPELLDQGPQAGLLRRPPQRPPLRGQPVPPAPARRRLLAARHPAPLAGRRRAPSACSSTPCACACSRSAAGSASCSPASALPLASSHPGEPLVAGVRRPPRPFVNYPG